MKPIHAVFALFLLLELAGCAASPVGSYQSTAVSNSILNSELALAARSYEGIDRNPVVIIHGFLGARLADPAGPVWGNFSTATFSDANLKALGLPMEIGKPLAALVSNVRQHDPRAALRKFPR